MSDQALPETEFLQELQAFVSEKWGGRPCDRCGTRQWSILPNDALLSITAHTLANLQMGNQVVPFSTRSYPVDFIAIYCVNCGNTVNVFKQVFDEWIRHRKTT
jgi:hypothetical protein